MLFIPFKSIYEKYLLLSANKDATYIGFNYNYYDNDIIKYSNKFLHYSTDLDLSNFSISTLSFYSSY